MPKVGAIADQPDADQNGLAQQLMNPGAGLGIMDNQDGSRSGQQGGQAGKRRVLVKRQYCPDNQAHTQQAA